MTRSSFFRRMVSTLCFLIITALLTASARPEGSEYTPKEGQAGKDVIWLPSDQSVVDRMLDLAKVTGQDYLIDLGSGDGRTVISAAKRGARLGVEYNPDMVSLSRRNAEKEGVADKAKFIQADLFQADLSQATVVTMFLLPDLNLRLRPRILALKPGTRIVSNSFDMGEWEADGIATENDCSAFCTAYLWLVPARVEGSWKFPDGKLTLRQSFQMVSGALQSGSPVVRISDGRLSGDQLSFTIGDTRYTAHVSGDTMEGFAKSGSSMKKWSATRTGEAARASR